MDLQTIVQELNKRFLAPLPEFYKRRIIIWYDEEREFEDQIDELELNNAKLLRLTGNNNFEIKKTIAIDEPTQNFLLYNPISYSKQDDNWLLDIELYSEEFRSDLISIWMDEMGIPSNITLRNQVKKYKKFLNAKSRREDVVKVGGTLDSNMKLQLAIMAAIGETQKTEPLAIIRSVLKAGLNDNDNYLYQEFVKYEAADLFWSMVSSITGYSDEEKNISKLATHIILTAGSRTLPTAVFDGLEQYMTFANQYQAYCSDLVSEWIQNDNESYRNIAEQIEIDMHLENRLSKQSSVQICDTEILPCINRIILSRLMTDIKNEIVNTDDIITITEKRRTLVWFDEYKDYYAGIVALAKMIVFYKDNAAGFHFVKVTELWDKYTKEFYKMDTYYRNFHMYYENTMKTYGGELHDLFTAVKDMVERIYSNWFLGGLGQNWSDIVAEDLKTNGYINGIDRQEQFYERKIAGSDSRAYVIISDALRYEVAVSLSEDISREMQGKVNLSSMQGIFPTITPFGMAALLPHNSISMDVKDDKDINVLVDNISAESTYREKILRSRNEKSVVLKAADLFSMSRAERSEKVKGMDVVYIYHDTIDETSHTSEQKVFVACDDTISEIKNLVKIIVNDFSGSNIMITADHGFLYTYSPLTEECKLEKDSFANRVVEISRRYAILCTGDDPDFLIPVKLLEGKTDYLGYATRGSMRIKSNAGSGMNFVHGGISLQEMCVPLIEYKHLRNNSKEYLKNKEKYDTKPVELTLLSSNHIVSNMIFSLNFHQVDPVSSNREAASYNVYFADANNKKVSDVQRIIADKKSDDLNERVFRCNFSLKSQAYDSKEVYYLVIEQDGSTDMPQKIEFQIDIAFAVEDFGF